MQDSYYIPSLKEQMEDCEYPFLDALFEGPIYQKSKRKK